MHMPRAIDFHVHLPTTEFIQITLGPYAKAAERYFRTEVKLKDIEQLAADYAELDMVGVLLAWDAETATGLPPLGNDYVAAIVQRYPKQFIGFASVDPHKGKAAVQEMERAIKELGLAGAKFHPGVQAFYPNDPTFYPLMEKIQELGVPALFHTGTNGLGAGTPGGMGIKLDYTRPIYLDSLAADFPGLTIIGAHPSWPWHEEMIAAMLHKTNIYNDLSGWSPRYIPDSLLREAATRLQDRFLFGSDYPFITPQRWLKDFEAVKIEFKPEVKEKLFWRNGQQLLAHTAVGKMSFS
jgi:predicted TIM-barrel fold metal-dependent hydrolase